MKLRSPFRGAHRQSGVALVVILAILVLVVGMSIAFLTLSTSERKSATIFVANTKLRQMADNAVGIVQAQINFATTFGSDVAWSSQPGMVRTYAANGDFATAFKLYSATTMTETDPTKLNGDLPSNGVAWSDSPALWTDLNAPAEADGVKVYPIVDPSVLTGGNVPQGFAITADAPTTATQTAPMPVRWLYLLSDGRSVVPTTGSGDTATIPDATAENPVVGRVAFWTDDESCKVNLNTASAGGFWDTPRFYTAKDKQFASSQPLNGEFQRYPGHPAMTSLNAVFPGLTDQQILSSITPRYIWGGSEQGTITTFRNTDGLNNGKFAAGPLYADTDELIFKPSHTSRDGNTLLTKDAVRRAGFFLTTSSKAPEVNLFNLPRVSCWPIASDPTRRTTFDNVIAFASSIGAYPYYFQRGNALSPTGDTAITRNQQLYGYLQYLTGKDIPGFGTKLADKFGVNNNQILTEIWDYIRSTNLYDTRFSTPDKPFTPTGWGYGYVAPLENGTTRGFGRGVTLSELAFAFICTADPKDTLTTPTPDPDGMLKSNDPATNRTLGGTRLQPEERRVQMMIIPELFSPSQGNIGMQLKNVRIKIEGLNSLTLDNKPLFAQDNGQLLFPSGSATFQLDATKPNTGYHRSGLGGPFDYRAAIAGGGPAMGSTAPMTYDAGILDTSVPSGAPRYPFISAFKTITLNPLKPGLMAFASGTLTVTIETSTDGSNWTTAQVITVAPPNLVDIPIPNLVRQGTVAGGGAPVTNARDWWAFSNSAPAGGASGRLANLGAAPGAFKIDGGMPVSAGYVQAGTLIREGENTSYHTDVVRSMVVDSGDTRLVAASKVVGPDVFKNLGNWTQTAPLVHTLGTGVQNGQHVPGSNQSRRHFVVNDPVGPFNASGGGNFGAGGVTAPDFPQSAPNDVLAQLQTTGDFDNSTSFWPDGAFINKPDEGNVVEGNATQIPYYDNAEKEEVDSKGFFSPNRITPGPGMFGSLPTHVISYQNNPRAEFTWRTLLFRKHPGHPNESPIGPNGLPSTAPDHLLMDLFWMPTVEPFAISEPFATMGKVNMNYMIQPFRYIERKTGLYAVLGREQISAVANGDAGVYKSSTDPVSPRAGNPTRDSYRLEVDVAQTLTQFDQRFAQTNGRIFLTPTELCDLWLVPKGQSVSSMETFWKNNRLTGDNTRERPYATIIPRLTTKSNTYTVYYRVQTLKPVKGAAAGAWKETQNAVTGEYRGSTTIERFIDSGNQTLKETDFATNTADKPTLDTFYRWRVLSNKQFAP